MLEVQCEDGWYMFWANGVLLLFLNQASKGTSSSQVKKKQLQDRRTSFTCTTFEMMLWYNFGHHLLSLAALLVIVSCGGGEQRRGTDSSTSSTGGSSSSGGSGSSSSSNNYSNRRFHKIQHGQCTYTFILPEGDGAGGNSCRGGKAGSPQYDPNSLQRDAPPHEPEFPSQKIQQLEHIMENYTQWLQKVRNSSWDRKMS